jgi:hypothetical protein
MTATKGIIHIGQRFTSMVQLSSFFCEKYNAI